MSMCASDSLDASEEKEGEVLLPMNMTALSAAQYELRKVDTSKISGNKLKKVRKALIAPTSTIVPTPRALTSTLCRDTVL